jgi:hypothetical protein
MGNGYATITINGEKVGLKFGIPAIRKYNEGLTPDMYSENDSQLNEYGTAHLFYCGYLNNCWRKQEKHPSLSFDVFLDYMDGIITNPETKAECLEAVKVFTESHVIKSRLDNPDSDNDDETKKKT